MKPILNFFNLNNYDHKKQTYLLFVLIPLIPMIFASIWQKQKEEDFIFVFLNACILYFPLFFLKKRKIYISLIFSFLLIPAILDFVHIFLYEARITLGTFFIIFDSNKGEAFEFIKSNFSFLLLFFTSIYVLFSLSLFKKVISNSDLINLKKWQKFLALWVLTPLIWKIFITSADISKCFEPYRRSSHILSMTYSYFEYKEQMQKFKRFSETFQDDFKVSFASDFPDRQTHILVIGESTSRNHMSLYGYQRDTNPKLQKMKKQLFIFKDVVSSNSSTIQNLKRIITLANKEDESSEKLGKNIISIFKSAGFKTYWVSNQMILGQYDTITSVFATQADKFNFTNTNDNINYISTLDEKVLPVYSRYLSEKVDKKFIVVHLMGSHIKYRERYPKEYNVFKDSRDLKNLKYKHEKAIKLRNEYDNTILYNDYIVSELINHAKRAGGYVSLTYLSDHGDEVYLDRNFHGHPGSTPTPNMYEIPFFIWTSEKFKKERNLQIEKYLDRKYVSDDIEHTLFDLIGVYPEEFDPTKSIINSLFIEKSRFADKLRI